MKDLKKCIEECLACVTACQNCATECVKKKHDCGVLLCLDCADICNLCAVLCIRSSDYLEALCRLCIAACNDCAVECEDTNTPTARPPQWHAGNVPTPARNIVPIPDSSISYIICNNKKCRVTI